MSRNHPVRNLVEVGFSGGFTRGSSFLATPGFVTGVPLGHGSARKLWIMGRYRPPLQSQSGTCRGGGGIWRRPSLCDVPQRGRLPKLSQAHMRVMMNSPRGASDAHNLEVLVTTTEEELG